MQPIQPRLADLITAFENSEPVLWSHVAPYRKSLKTYIERTEFAKAYFVATFITNSIQGGILFTNDSLAAYGGKEDLLLESWVEL